MEASHSSTLQLVKENISWISDLTTILFTSIATIIGILTYQKAKKSLLQPVKSEVIHRQTSMLTDLLTFLTKQNGFDRGFDYEGIVYLSLYSVLKDHGFILNNRDVYEKELEEKSDGLLVVSTSKALERFEKDQPLLDLKQQEKRDKRKKEFERKRFVNLKKGEIDIDVLHVTKKHNLFSNQISEFAKDPFMPKEIAENLNKVLDDATLNIKTLIKSSLEEFLLEYSKHYFKGNKTLINYGGVFNIFNEKRLSHKFEEDKIRAAIRKFMRVDEGWD